MPYPSTRHLSHIAQINDSDEVNEKTTWDRWQMISDDKVWMFPVEKWLSTVEMMPGWIDDFGYQYESCLFQSNKSEVVKRYKTKEEAIEGHRKLAEQYELKNEKVINEF